MCVGGVKRFFQKSLNHRHMAQGFRVIHIRPELRPCPRQGHAGPELRPCPRQGHARPELSSSQRQEHARLELRPRQHQEHADFAVGRVFRGHQPAAVHFIVERHHPAVQYLHGSAIAEPVM